MQQQREINAYRYVTERNKSRTSKVRMNLEPAFVSAETQTHRNEDMVIPCSNSYTYKVVHHPRDQPAIIKQYGGTGVSTTDEHIQF